MIRAFFAAFALTVALCGCVNLVQAPQNAGDSISMQGHGGVAVVVTKSGDKLIDTGTLIGLAVEDPRIRAVVKKTYGAIDSNSFGAYFASPAFVEFAKQLKVELAKIVFVEKLTYESNQEFEPNSLIITADAPTHIYVKFSDSSGHLEMGGSSVNIAK